MSRRWLALIACLVPLTLGACRKVVVDRDFGRVDGAKSIATNSDPAWKIEREPAPTPAAAN